MSGALRWVRRVEVPTPDAVLARGPAVAALAAVTADRVEAGVRLQVARTAGALLVIGVTEHLPWVDGVSYLVRDGSALVSTTHTCQPVAALVAQAVRMAAGRDLPDEVAAGVRGATVVLTPDGPPLLTAPPRGVPTPDQLRGIADGLAS